MGSIPGVKYDFKAARARIDMLILLYRVAKKQGDDMACWEMSARIEDIEKEIEEAHASRKGKMVTARNSNHPVIHIENLITPIVAHWGQKENSIFEELQV